MQKALILFLGILLFCCSQKSAEYKFDGTWLLLNQTDSGQFILQPCGINTEAKWIIHDSIYTDDYEGKILSDYKLQKENDRYIYSEDNEKSEYRFIDIQNRIIEETVFRNGVAVGKFLYVDSTNISQYKIIEQPCEECWVKEECVQRENQEKHQKIIESLKENKPSVKWLGKYSLLLDEGHNVGGDYTGVGYDLTINADSILFTGVGYQVYFKVQCLSNQNSDSLEIYFYKLLDGGFTPIEESILPIIKMYKKGDGYYFKSDYFGEPNEEYKME